MLKRILGIIGWIGTGVIFAAVAVRFVHPAWERYSYWMAWEWRRDERESRGWPRA